MIRYATLFTVDILHDYYLNRGVVVHEALSEKMRNHAVERYDVGAFVDIAPTERTRARLAGHRMIFKTTRTGFLVAVRTDTLPPHLRPAVPPAADLSLSFALTIGDPRFFNYTELAASRQGLYRFSNAGSNAAAGQLFLTMPVPGFDATRTYEAGAIRALSAAGVVDLFRAVRDTGPSVAPVVADWERIPADTWNPGTLYTSGAVVLAANRVYRARVDAPGIDLSDAADWEAIAVLANQYVCSADKIELRPALFNLDLSGAALARATVRIYRVGEANAVAERAYSAPSGTLGLVPVDLRDLAPCACRLEVLDDALAPVAELGFEFYVDKDAARDARFGIIDIGGGSGGFALLDGGGALRSPRYIVRFLNRSTRWRYIFPQAQPVGVGADVAVEGGDPRVLVTSAPRPLTYFGTGIRLQADNVGTPAVSEEVLLPLPEPHRIRRDNQQWYSEIHLSNLPV